MKTILVLGVGLSNALIIRQIMRQKVLPSKEYKMIVVAPNTHFHWPIGMVRAVVPGQLSDEKVMIPLEPIFKQYPADKFEFVVGKAGKLDPSSSTVVVNVSSGATRSIQYDALVIGTGSSVKDSNVPWKALDSTAETTERLHSVQADIKNAKTIVVGGGGFTGIETAGELGFEYSKDGRKEVYFVHDQPLPLNPPVLDSVRKATASELAKLKVKVITNTKITNATRNGKDFTLELTKSDGTTQTLTAQAYLPATGVAPNSSFAPASMLDSRGFIKQDKNLRAEGHKNIFLVGDVGSLQTCQAMFAERQAVHLIKALPLYLNGAALPEYVVDTKPVFAVTTGRSRGTGQFGNFKMFSFLVWFVKGRFLGTDYAPQFGAGKRGMQANFEK